jgi:hypothetical protein
VRQWSPPMSEAGEDAGRHAARIVHGAAARAQVQPLPCLRARGEEGRVAAPAFFLRVVARGGAPAQRLGDRPTPSKSSVARAGISNAPFPAPDSVAAYATGPCRAGRCA